MRKPRILISTSGGRSSALMAYLLWRRFKDVYEMIFVFANTSREKEETLLFVHQLETIFGLPIVWVEAVVHHGTRKGSTHKIVNYETACRDGSVFEEVIKKYGIPNKVFKHCTRELKANPIRDYARSIGWRDWKKYTTVIGYRKDEPRRVNLLTMAEKHQWYPLWEWGIKKPDVATFWLKQEFDLQLEDYDGNCDLCHKKDKRKQLTQIAKGSDPSWHIEMEEKYEEVKPGKRSKMKEPCRFFRNSESIHDLVKQSKEHFELSTDKSLITDGATYEFDPELDEREDCAESCEPF